MRLGSRRRRSLSSSGIVPSGLALLLIAALGCKSQGGAQQGPAPAKQEVAPVEEPAVEAPAPPVDDGPPGAVAHGRQGAVASAEAHASDIGLEILKKGGNAVDAAIAVGFALAVTHPSAGNLGGGGFMVVRMNGEAVAFDYRELAPAAAHRDMYLDKDGNPTRDSVDGPRAAGIPGTVAGFAMAHERFGSLPWADLVTPAVRLARDGHTLDSFHASDLERAVERMEKLAIADSAKHYKHPEGRVFREGETWLQPELGETLAMIAKDGPRSFYEGPFADKLAGGVKDLGGIWTPEDLAHYQAIAREPVTFSYRGHEFITMPPPSAGGVVMRQLLAASEILEINKYPWHSVDEIHLYVEAARRTYADRNMLLADPAFVEIPMKTLLDPTYMKDRLADVDLNHATPSDKVGVGLDLIGGESHETTHFSVVDGNGNAVANTYTLNTGFGAKVVVPGTGVLLNNEMDDFAAKPGTPNTYGLVQGEQNRVEAGKRMLSSMTPTIVTKGGKLRAVVGTPGGSTITTTVTQIVRALIDYEQPLVAAVRAPRIHHQWKPDRIMMEPTVDAAIVEGLQARGHEVFQLSEEKGWTRIGHANCIEVDPKTGAYTAVADVERDGGKASAY